VEPEDRRVHLEVIDKGTGCAACRYMHAAATRALNRFARYVTYTRINLRSPRGRQRFLELCEGLYGYHQVHRQLRLAPVPSLFINGRLAFETIPDEVRLEEAIAGCLAPAP
jgi:hypothetical protein